MESLGWPSQSPDLNALGCRGMTIPRHFMLKPSNGAELQVCKFPPQYRQILVAVVAAKGVPTS